VLSGIEFLESKNIVHGNLTCSNILLNDDGHVKIGVQECCTTISKGDNINHPDVQAVEDIMMQLLEKRRKSDKAIGANDLRRWSSTAKGFLSKIKSASAEKLLQVSLNLSRCRLP
jgi:tRNA A-37 threonylcarbamoyl transferase component Bud32